MKTSHKNNNDYNKSILYTFDTIRKVKSCVENIIFHENTLLGTGKKGSFVNGFAPSYTSLDSMNMDLEFAIKKHDVMILNDMCSANRITRFKKESTESIKFLEENFSAEKQIHKNFILGGEHFFLLKLYFANSEGRNNVGVNIHKTQPSKLFEKEIQLALNSLPTNLFQYLLPKDYKENFLDLLKQYIILDEKRQMEQQLVESDTVEPLGKKAGFKI